MFCAYTRPNFQVNVDKTIGPLVIIPSTKRYSMFTEQPFNYILLYVYNHIEFRKYIKCNYQR